jgi:LacI family transcriptional regulator
VVDDADETLKASAQRLLEGADRPDAVFATYELPAIAVLAKAAELGIAVPGDLMVAGPSDFGLAEHSEPPMTTLEYDAERHGREAADMLVRLLRGETIEQPRRTLPVTLVERESTRR